MRLSMLCTAAALTLGSIGLAYAGPTNLIQNGTFSSVNTSLMQGGGTAPNQFGETDTLNGFTPQQFINGWLGNNGYEIWYNNPTDASTVDAWSGWGQGSNSNTNKEMLYGPVTSPPNGTMTFVGLDGDQAPGVQSSISQTVGGLTVGKSYTVSFDWALGQVQSRTGPTTEQLAITFGTSSASTSIEDNPSQSFTGWFSASFNFVADSTSQLLSFLSVGTPGGFPPMALLTNVSLFQTSVPEPPELALFGGGLLGLGLLTLYTRKRGQRRDAENGIG